MHAHTNHLIHETSPYLLQHAHNPVDWFPWGDEALQKAREENKPILVSIGYAACHWCHVMENESFEDEATAEFMNAEFVNIKIDREERPDLDHIYMDAVQAMTGSGGWPLNVFLTPEGKPFFGGTYFPPSRAHNRPSWTEVLQNISQLFSERRNEVNAQAENLTAHLLQSNSIVWQKQGGDTIASEKTLQETFENIIKQADKEWGGFGRAPKFPQSFTIQFLLRYSYVTADRDALGQAMLSLDKMIAGGIYDQVGGGFARYSTDTEWLAPHFEKMLYDNALLVAVLSEAYQFTKKDRYREVIVETMDFVIRELMHPGKAFYSALDADSEGEEGKFYVWDMAEVEQVLGENADIFCRYFDITPQGNWEEKNILRVNEPQEKFAETENISINSLRQSIDRGRAMLLEARSKRVRPLLDDKIILGWNALMNTACGKAFMATGENKYRELAIANMQFLLKTFSPAGGNELCHTWKNNVAKYPAFLDDYAFLIQALIQLQEITSDVSWLLKARDLAEFVIGHYSETDTGLFYYTIKDQKDVIIRKKEIYDGAVPSGNSVMAYNLYQLGIYFDRSDWKAQSRGMVANLGEIISRYPTSFGVWACLMQESTVGTFEIAILGKNYERLQADLFKNYLPHRVIMGSETGDDEFPILAAKTSGEKPVIYLCKEFVCQQPVDSIERFMSLIDRV